MHLDPQDPTTPAANEPAAGTFAAPPLFHAGMRLTVIIDGATAGGRLSVCELLAPTGAGMPTHCHANEDEIVSVLEGAVEVVLGDAAPRTLGPGEAQLLPRGVPHRVRGASGPPHAAPARFLTALLPGGLEATLQATATDDPTTALDADDLAALLTSAGVSLLPWRG